MGTRPGTLDKDDLIKIGKGFLIASIGAGLTWLVDKALPELQQQELINATLFAVFSTVVNALRKCAVDTRFALLIAAVVGSAVPGFAQEHRAQPIRGVLRGITPHVLIVGVDGVRGEIRGMRDEGRGQSQQTAGLWTWSASGQAHHAAVVRVSNPVDGGAGSGVYCQLGGRAGVLTCAHLEPRDKLRVTFADGTSQEGAATVDKFKHDICFVFVTHPSITPAAIAVQDVRPGESVEFATYGGPDAMFRHFLGNVTTTGNRLEVATPVTHGDSGAPVFNQRGEVVGIQSVGMGQTLTNSRGFNVYESSGAVGWAPLTQFVGRCFGGQCEPGAPGRQSPAGGSGGDVDFYPPPAVQQQAQQVNPMPGPQPASDPPAAVSVDYDRLSAIVLAQLEQDIRSGKYSDELRGPAGQPGPPASIDVDELARRLPPVVLSIDGAQQSAPLGQPIKLQNQQRKVR